MKIRETNITARYLTLMVAMSVVLGTSCSQQAPVQAPAVPADATADGAETAAGQTPVSSTVDVASTQEAVAMGPAIPEDLQSPPAQSGGECGIESTATLPQGAELSLSRSRAESVEGWALSRETAAKASRVYIKLASDGGASYFAPVTMVTRPGLGIRLNDEARDDAGFKVTFDLHDVPTGAYTVQVAQRIDGKVLLCATGRTATVAD